MSNSSKHKSIKEILTPSHVFLFVAVLNIVLLIVFLVITGGQFLSEVVWDARNHLFADFFTHVGRVRGGRNPYVVEDWDARFPAFAYMFYYFLSCIIPEQIKNSIVTDWYNMYMIILLCICLTCIVAVIFESVKGSFAFKLGLALVFVLSHTFALSEIKAGNSAVYVLTLLVLALYLKDTDSRVGREAALILIAFAAGFKISPAIMGFIYIKEKRFSEAIRLVIYGIIAFFAPFAMFDGLEGLKIFLNISGQVSNAAIPRPETISGVIIEFFSVVAHSEQTGLIVGRIVSFGYLILCMFLFFKCKYSWKTLCLLSSLMVIFVNLSYPYTLQYFLIPIIAFVKEESEEKVRWKYFYGILFALIFTVYPLIRINWPTATFITNYFCVYILVFALITDLIIEVKENGSKPVEEGT